MEALPDVASPVENPPRDVQEVVLVELQVSVEDWPLLMVEGLAERTAVGGKILHAGGLIAPFAQEGVNVVTVTDCMGDVPPGPEHWNVKLYEGSTRGPVCPLPESVPELFHEPPEVQLVALVELQEMSSLLPCCAGFGVTVSVAVGGCMVTVTI